MGFSRQEYWSGLPCPPPGGLLDPAVEPRSPGLQADPLPSEPPGKSYVHIKLAHKCSQKFIYNSYKLETIQISILTLVNELWHIHWMKHYTATKMNRLCFKQKGTIAIYATWMDLKIIMLSKRGQRSKACTQCDPMHENSSKCEWTHSDRQQIGAYLGRTHLGGGILG